METDLIDKLNKLISETVLLKNEIHRLNTRINYKITKELINKKKLNNNIFHYYNSSKNPDKRNYEDVKFQNGVITINFD